MEAREQVKSAALAWQGRTDLERHEVNDNGKRNPT